MAHFARLDDSGTVVQVIVVGNPDCLDENGSESEAVGIAFCKSLYGTDTQWLQTSINNRIRKNYAGVGYNYDAQRDAFISPSPYPSWVLDEQTCRWIAPVPMPDDGQLYQWDEFAGDWVLS